MDVKTVSYTWVILIVILLFLVALCYAQAVDAQAAQYSLASAFDHVVAGLPSADDADTVTLSWVGNGNGTDSQLPVLSYESFQSFLMQYLKSENTYIVTIGTADGSTISAQFVMPASRPMKVLITYACDDINHVGNEWGYAFSVGGTGVRSGDTVILTADENIELYTKITEFDEYDDIGDCSTDQPVTQEDVFNGFSVEQSVAVTEHHGTYSGNTAIWTVIYTFSPY